MPVNNENIQTTEKDGFITSQQYVTSSEYNSNDKPNSNTTESAPEEKKKPKKKDKNAPRETVVTFQLVVCIILAIVAFVIKSVGGDFYKNAREIYYSNLNNSIIIDMKNDNNKDFISDTINENKSQEN